MPRYADPDNRCGWLRVAEAAGIVAEHTKMRGHRLRNLRVAIQAGSEGWLGGLALGVGSDCEGGGGLLWRGQ